jgi:IclR family transcriptional regulator, KDG regulon repressor
VAIGPKGVSVVRGKDDVSQESLERGDALIVRSVVKALRVLNLFTVERSEWTEKEIVRATGFPRPTVYRLIRTLEEELFLLYNPATSGYHLGPAMIPALYVLKNHSNLVRLLQGQLKELADVAGEHASLAVGIENTAVVIDAVSSSYNPFQPMVPVGRVHEGVVTAHTKIMAAFGKPEEVELLSQPQTARTPHTIVDPQELFAELERVKREQVAYDIEENWTGVCGVAAPVRDRSGTVIASVSVVVSIERFGLERRRLLADIVKTYGLKMSLELGYSPERVAQQAAAD